MILRPFANGLYRTLSRAERKSIQRKMEKRNIKLVRKYTDKNGIKRVNLDRINTIFCILVCSLKINNYLKKNNVDSAKARTESWLGRVSGLPKTIWEADSDPPS